MRFYTQKADGLSRRDAQPGDEIFPHSEENLDEPSGILEVLPDKNGGDPPLDFEEFKDQIDTRGGFVQTLALSICDFHDEIDREEALQAKFAEGIKVKIDKDKNDLECSKEQKDFLRTFVVAPLIPDWKDRYTELLAEDQYPEEGHSFVGKSQDEWLPLIRSWLKNPVKRPEGLMDKQYPSFTRFAKGFFVDKENRLYRRSTDSCHKLVVDKSHRMYMMQAAHDSLGHFARRKIHLEEEIGRLIDLNKEGLDKLDEEGLEDRTDSNDYAFEGVNLDETGLDGRRVQ